MEGEAESPMEGEEKTDGRTEGRTDGGQTVADTHTHRHTHTQSLAFNREILNTSRARQRQVSPARAWRHLAGGVTVVRLDSNNRFVLTGPVLPHTNYWIQDTLIPT